MSSTCRRCSPACSQLSGGMSKLSYKEQRELDALPGLIDALEAEQAALAGRLADAGIHAGDPTLLAAAQDRLLRIDEELDQALERWEALGSP
jgi:ATP-binding cassette subfamily F protein uup